MNEEKLRIMEMIKDGTITPEEGLEIIEALGPSQTALVPKPDDTALVSGFEDKEEAESGDSSEPKRKARWLYIQVNEEDGKNVNIRIPIGLAKFAGKFIPSEAKKQMAEQGVDLDLHGLLEMLEKEGQQNLVEVNEGDGKTVRIFTK